MSDDFETMLRKAYTDGHAHLFTAEKVLDSTEAVQEFCRFIAEALVKSGHVSSIWQGQPRSDDNLEQKTITALQAQIWYAVRDVVDTLPTEKMLVHKLRTE